MGCGSSRMDALEPHYLEGWTKETESTWLTSTDTDIPLSSIQSISSETSSEGFTSEKTSTPMPGLFEDGLPHLTLTYVKAYSSLSEASLDERQTSPPAICASQEHELALTSSGTTPQHSAGAYYTQKNLQRGGTSSKQLTITVTQSIQQVDKSGKLQKSLEEANARNTSNYEQQLEPKRTR